MTQNIQQNNIDERKKMFPKFLMLLSFVELWERFSYYGMRALLILYLTTQMNMTDGHAGAIYGLFAATGYAGPIIFGMLADKYFGPKYMIYLGGMIMLVGHGVMALTDMNHNLIYVGLSLIAVGTGAFKGNITNMLGLCYKKLQHSNENTGYTVFYVAVNVGSFFASILCGTIGMKVGWHYGFGLAGIGMFIGLLTLFMYSSVLEGVGNQPKDISFQKIATAKTTLMIGLAASILAISYGLQHPDQFNMLFNIIGPAGLIYYLYIAVTGDKKDVVNMMIIVIFMLFSMIFFALEMQVSGLIKLYADRNVDLVVNGYEISSGAIDALNPLTIMIVGMLLSFITLKDKFGELRFAFGLSCIPFCFISFYVGGLYAVKGIVSFLPFVIGMAMMSIGELFVAPYVQLQISKLSPSNSRGFLFGFSMFSMSYANIIGAKIAQYLAVENINGIVDPVYSLEIYQNGFKQIIYTTSVVTLMFVIGIPIISRYKALSTDSRN